MTLRSLLSRRPPRPAGFPIAPGALPVVGHLPLLHDDAVGVLRRGREALGPLLWVNLGFGRWRLFCLGPESLDLLRSPAVNSDGAYEDLKHMAGRSIFMRDGQPHQRARSVLNPPFTPRGLEQHEAGERMAAMITERAAAWVERGSIDLLEETQGLALDVVFRVTGIRVEDLPAWREQYREFALGIYPIPLDLPGAPRRRSIQAARWLDERLLEMLADARRTPGGPGGRGLLHALVRARSDDGSAPSDQELVDNLRMTSFAGHETTAAGLAWMLITLATEPALWDALCEEARGAGGARVPMPTSLAEARAFPCAEAIFREALRLYTPAWFLFRKSAAPHSYAGREIPAGTPLAVSPALLGRDPRLFDDPDRFDASRWLSRSAPLAPFELAQFGGGAHFCLGYHLAWMESIQALVAVAQAATRRGVRPRLPGSLPRQVYYPMGHPAGRPRLLFSV